MASCCTENSHVSLPVLKCGVFYFVVMIRALAASQVPFQVDHLHCFPAFWMDGSMYFSANFKVWVNLNFVSSTKQKLCFKKMLLCTKAAWAMPVQGWVYLLLKSPFIPISGDMASTNHVTTFSCNMLELFFPSGIHKNVYSYVRGSLPCKGMHSVCCIENTEQQCLEQDRASSRTVTGLIMQKIVATETPVLQATRWYGHWYVVTWGGGVVVWGFVLYSYVLANWTKMK